VPVIRGTEIGYPQRSPGIEKFFDILEEVKKEEQTTIETLFDLRKTKSKQLHEVY